MRAALLFGLLLPLSTVIQAATADPLVDKGQAIVKSHCSRCHAIGPTGESPDPESPPFRMLSKKYPVQNFKKALAEGIIVGHEDQGMPPFAFSPSQIEAVIAYLRSVQAK